MDTGLLDDPLRASQLSQSKQLGDELRDMGELGTLDKICPVLLTLFQEAWIRDPSCVEPLLRRLFGTAASEEETRERIDCLKQPIYDAADMFARNEIEPAGESSFDEYLDIFVPYDYHGMVLIDELGKLDRACEEEIGSGMMFWMRMEIVRRVARSYRELMFTILQIGDMQSKE